MRARADPNGHVRIREWRADACGMLHIESATLPGWPLRRSRRPAQVGPPRRCHPRRQWR